MAGAECSSHFLKYAQNKKYTFLGVFSKIKYYVIISFETTGSRFFYSLASGGDVMTVFEALSLMIAFATLVVLILTYRK